MFEKDEYINEDFSNYQAEEPELSKLKFQSCNFTSADFGDVDIIFGCVFRECNFSGAAFGGVKLRNCSFLNCRFPYANLFATIFENCKMTGSALSETDCALIDIIGGDWSYTELRYVEFDRKTFSDVNFRGADLYGTAFRKSTLIRCNFEEALMHEVSFQGADIRSCELRNTDLYHTDFKDTKVDLQQCVAIAESRGARYEP